MQNNIEMTDPYYPRNPAVLPDFDRQQGNYAKIYRPEEHTSFTSVPMGEVITEQPIQSYGSQISTGMPSNFGRGGPVQMISPQIGIPLPGLEVLDRIPSFKIHTAGLLEGHTTCSPGYRIYNLQGELMLNGTSDTLFCPFDSKQKSIYIKDSSEDCIFQVKFTPSICECDSEEKRCFAVFSPVFENPFGAILFEAGQLKYSMKILNALEGETFAVQFLGSQDVSVKLPFFVYPNFIKTLLSFEGKLFSKRKNLVFHLVLNPKRELALAASSYWLTSHNEHATHFFP
ncbi:unnamed protein product [Orchesella dallaii]|uniref:Phospholipid scramblase n=1 Tax=Orchesella dallaii TaxID=48710 RepID=A0ABP1RFU9_9HEXA